MEGFFAPPVELSSRIANTTIPSIAYFGADEIAEFFHNGGSNDCTPVRDVLLRVQAGARTSGQASAYRWL